MSANERQENPDQPCRFASTRWSLVAAAGHASSPGAQEALATLCGVYWYPLYAFARRQMPNRDDAQDLTQGFFAQLLEKDYLHTAQPERGKFRSFLLTAFKRYLARERDRATAQKRGGGRSLFTLDFQNGESRYHLEPVDNATPEKIFERRWALTLLEQTLARLRQEFELAGKQRLFEALKGTLTGDGAPGPYATLVRELEMSEQAIKVAVHRLRKRYGELLRAEVAETVAAPADIDDELRNLFVAVRGEKS